MKQANFALQNFSIEVAGEAHPFTLNQVLMLRYVEDIQSATVRMEAQITDSQSGVLSKIEGMEPVVIAIQDEDENVLEMGMVIYDVQDRVMVAGRWVVIDSQIPDLDLEKLKIEHQMEAKRLQKK